MTSIQPSPGTASRRELLRKHVAAKAASLQSRHQADDSAAKATLAALRGAISAPIGADPRAYEAVFGSIDERLLGHGDEPGSAEQAAHLALTLFALHRQGAGASPSHMSGRGLGQAVGSLARPDDSDSREKPIMRRFTALVTATELSEIAHHLRGIVQLLRSHRGGPLPLDYGQLAADLLDLQDPHRRDGVRLRWSREALARRRDAELGAEPEAQSADPAASPDPADTSDELV